MTRRRFTFIAVFTVGILLFWGAAQYFNALHQNNLRIREERLAQQTQEEAQQLLEEKLRNGTYGQDNEKVVFLTFDGSPMGNSDQVLNILRDNDIKATFFTNGSSSETGDQTYSRILDEGHVLGYESGVDNPETLLANIEALQAHQERVTGVESEKIFRFSDGSDKILQESVDSLSENGYNYVDWNVYVDRGITSDDVFKQIIDGVHANSVSVVKTAFEDPAENAGLKGLDDAIKQLKNEGYTFMVIEPDYQLARFVQPTGSTQRTTTRPGNVE